MVLTFLALWLAPPPVDVQQTLAQFVEASGVPGAAIVRVRAGERLETHYAGVAEKGTGRAISPSTVFHAASVSKQITAWAALRLAERGDLDLDRPLNEYVGEVVESDPPHRLVQTWRMLMDEQTAREPFTTLTYEITELPTQPGVCRLTVVHDLTGAPVTAAMTAGSQEESGAGGGWAWVLSDLKTLVETGSAFAA